VRDYLVELGRVASGDRVVVVTNNDDAYRTALASTARGSSSP
jgi:sarcosine oxidase subunit alpha